MVGSFLHISNAIASYWVFERQREDRNSDIYSFMKEKNKTGNNQLDRGYSNPAYKGSADGSGVSVGYNGTGEIENPNYQPLAIK